MEVAEDFLGPQVHSTLSWIAVSQLDHSDALWPEEQQQSDDPQPDCDPAVGRNRRNHIQIEDRDHEQQDQVPPAEYSLQMRLGGVVIFGGQMALLGLITLPLVIPSQVRNLQLSRQYPDSSLGSE